MAESEVEAFLTHLAIHNYVAALTRTLQTLLKAQLLQTQQLHKDDLSQGF